jgi:cytidylate kinase
MAKCLLDTGCTKSMILKKFTDKKRRNKLSKEQTIVYETYGGKFTSSMTASVGFKMIEFQQHQNQTIEYEFQIDETSNSKQQNYDMIIGNDLLWNMGINILYNEQQIQ